MKFTTRVATIDDLENLCEIEKSATPSLLYIEENAKFFFEESPGEIYVVDNGEGYLVGMGRYTTLPDGSGWLETLRVHKDFQGMGAGKLIYKEYLKYAKENNAPAIRMYTERNNVRSKGLAELNGFGPAAELANYDIEVPQDISGEFKLQQVKNVEELDLESIKNEWGNLIALNRTFYEINEENIQWMIDQGMVYKDGESLLIFGARMLKERGQFIALAMGDLDYLVKSALIKAKDMNAKKLFVVFPYENSEFINVMENMNFNKIYNLLVMEKRCE